MPRTNYFSQYDSPNIVIVPTVTLLNTPATNGKSDNENSAFYIKKIDVGQTSNTAIQGKQNYFAKNNINSENIESMQICHVNNTIQCCKSKQISQTNTVALQEFNENVHAVCTEESQMCQVNNPALQGTINQQTSKLENWQNNSTNSNIDICATCIENQDSQIKAITYQEPNENALSVSSEERQITNTAFQEINKNACGMCIDKKQECQINIPVSLKSNNSVHTSAEDRLNCPKYVTAIQETKGVNNLGDCIETVPKKNNDSWASNYLKSIGQIYKKPIKLNMLPPEREQGFNSNIINSNKRKSATSDTSVKPPKLSKLNKVNLNDGKTIIKKISNGEKTLIYNGNNNILTSKGDNGSCEEDSHTNITSNMETERKFDSSYKIPKFSKLNSNIEESKTVNKKPIYSYSDNKKMTSNKNCNKNLTCNRKGRRHEEKKYTNILNSNTKRGTAFISSYKIPKLCKSSVRDLEETTIVDTYSNSNDNVNRIDNTKSQEQKRFFKLDTRKSVLSCDIKKGDSITSSYKIQKSSILDHTTIESTTQKNSHSSDKNIIYSNNKGDLIIPNKRKTKSLKLKVPIKDPKSLNIKKKNKVGANTNLNDNLSSKITIPKTAEKRDKKTRCSDISTNNQHVYKNKYYQAQGEQFNTIKSVVHIPKHFELRKSKTSDDSDLRTKLNRNHKESNLIKDNSTKLSKEKRDNLIVTVKNEEQVEIKSTKNVNEPKTTRTSNINVVINIIYKGARPSDNETVKCDKKHIDNTISEDLSFLDDFNVDEIVESLNTCEDKYIDNEHIKETHETPGDMDTAKMKLNENFPKSFTVIKNNTFEKIKVEDKLDYNIISMPVIDGDLLNVTNVTKNVDTDNRDSNTEIDVRQSSLIECKCGNVCKEIYLLNQIANHNSVVSLNKCAIANTPNNKKCFNNITPLDPKKVTETITIEDDVDGNSTKSSSIDDHGTNIINNSTMRQCDTSSRLNVTIVSQPVQDSQVIIIEDDSDGEIETIKREIEDKNNENTRKIDSNSMEKSNKIENEESNSLTENISSYTEQTNVLIKRVEEKIDLNIRSLQTSTDRQNPTSEIRNNSAKSTEIMKQQREQSKAVDTITALIVNTCNSNNQNNANLEIDENDLKNVNANIIENNNESAEGIINIKLERTVEKNDFVANAKYIDNNTLTEVINNIKVESTVLADNGHYEEVNAELFGNKTPTESINNIEREQPVSEQNNYKEANTQIARNDTSGEVIDNIKQEPVILEECDGKQSNVEILGKNTSPKIIKNIKIDPMEENDYKGVNVEIINNDTPAKSISNIKPNVVEDNVLKNTNVEIDALNKSAEIEESNYANKSDKCGEKLGLSDITNKVDNAVNRAKLVQKLTQNTIVTGRVSVRDLENRINTFLRAQFSVTSIIHTGEFSKILECKKQEKSYAIKMLINTKGHSLGMEKEKMFLKLQREIPKENLNCVYLFDGLSVLGHWCLIMEYYPMNLKETLEKQEKSFHIDVVKKLGRQLVSAVTVLRNNNIIHSDIKPSHILINDAHDRIKLCGFDESYYLVTETVVAPNVGTVNYRAPEVILGYFANHAIDVWSTGLVMYEMATNQQLFPGVFNNDILYKHICTLGAIPQDMLENSAYTSNHFINKMFKRRVGFMGKNIVLVNKFHINKKLQGSIFNAYNTDWQESRTGEECAKDLDKLMKFYTLLKKMLIIHPQHRLAIEFVYANEFIF